VDDQGFTGGAVALRPARGVVAAQQSFSLVVKCSVWVQLINIQCSLDLSFLRGPAKINDECGKTINPKHHFF
jgi:hypothetical protein